jgi:hypothetical protein
MAVYGPGGPLLLILEPPGHGEVLAAEGCEGVVAEEGVALVLAGRGRGVGVPRDRKQSRSLVGESPRPGVLLRAKVLGYNVAGESAPAALIIGPPRCLVWVDFGGLPPKPPGILRFGACLQAGKISRRAAPKDRPGLQCRSLSRRSGCVPAELCPPLRCLG